MSDSRRGGAQEPVPTLRDDIMRPSELMAKPQAISFLRLGNCLGTATDAPVTGPPPGHTDEFEKKKTNLNICAGGSARRRFAPSSSHWGQRVAAIARSIWNISRLHGHRPKLVRGRSGGGPGDVGVRVQCEEGLARQGPLRCQEHQVNGRSVRRIYFITNQYVRDKVRPEVEEELTNFVGCPVHILDRTWILRVRIQSRSGGARCRNARPRQHVHTDCPETRTR